MKFRISFSGAAIGVVLSLLGSSWGAQALPVLRETRSDYSGKMATIYPDNNDPNLFYFLPDSSEFAQNSDQSPVITLTHWGLLTPDLTDGGAMMNFVLKAAITPELNAELLAFQKKHPNARLTVIPFGASFVSIGNSKTGAPQLWSKLIVGADLPPNAGVAETEVGVNMLLTELGAKVFKASIEKSPDYNIQLCFKIDGVTPYMDASITMDYKRVYEYFQASASGGYLWWQVSVAAVVEKLREDGTITIKLTNTDAKMEDIVMELTRDLMKTWFTPTLSASPGASNPEGLAPGRFVSFSFNSTYKEERKTVSFRFQKSVAIQDDRCVNLAMKGLSKYASSIITSAD